MWEQLEKLTNLVDTEASVEVQGALYAVILHRMATAREWGALATVKKIITTFRLFEDEIWLSNLQACYRKGRQALDERLKCCHNLGNYVELSRLVHAPESGMRGPVHEIMDDLCFMLSTAPETPAWAQECQYLLEQHTTLMSNWTQIKNITQKMGLPCHDDAHRILDHEAKMVELINDVFTAHDRAKTETQCACQEIAEVLDNDLAAEVADFEKHRAVWEKILALRQATVELCPRTSYDFKILLKRQAMVREAYENAIMGKIELIQQEQNEINAIIEAVLSQLRETAILKQMLTLEACQPD